MKRNGLRCVAVTESDSAWSTAARPTARRRRRRRSSAVFIVTALGAFMASLDLSIVNVAFPALERSFPTTPGPRWPGSITGYSIVFGSLLVTAGRTADRLGRRRVFFAGLAVFTPGLGAVRAGPVGRLCWSPAASSRACGAAAMLPSSLGLLLGAFPERAALPGRGPVGRRRSPGRGHRAVPRRAPRSRPGGWRWAFYRQPARRRWWPGWSGRRVLVESKPEARSTSAPTTRVSCW